MHPSESFTNGTLHTQLQHHAVSFNTIQRCSQIDFYIQNTGQKNFRKTIGIIMMFISFLFLETVFHYVAPNWPQTRNPAVLACKSKCTTLDQCACCLSANTGHQETLAPRVSGCKHYTATTLTRVDSSLDQIGE